MASSNSKPPTIAGTLQTDPRSGGIKRSSGVNVLPNVSGKGPFLVIRDFHFVHPCLFALSFKQLGFFHFLPLHLPGNGCIIVSKALYFIIFSLFFLPVFFQICIDAWSEVRDDSNTDVDWILIGYDGNSKTDLTLIEKGKGGMAALSAKLDAVASSAGGAVFGGTRLQKNGRFVHFVYVNENCPAMKKGRTLMYKNGVFNVLMGCDGEIEMTPGLTEEQMGPIR